MSAVGRRYAPSLEDTGLLPENSGVAFQINIKKRCGLCRLTGSVESLSIRRPIQGLKAIPSVDSYIARGPSQRKDTNAALPLAAHYNRDEETVRRDVPVITAHCRVSIDPSQLMPLALQQVKAVKDLVPGPSLAEDAQSRRKTSAADVIKARLIPHQLTRSTFNGNLHQVA